MMKKTIVILIVMACLLVGFIGFNQLQIWRLPEHMRSSNKENQAIGKLKKIQRIDHNKAISIFYPQFNHKKIDTQIKQFIDETIKEFERINNVYQTRDSKNKALLYIDYETYDLENKFGSIILCVQQSGVINKSESKTWVFDLKEDELIYMHDLFVDRYLEKISALTRSFFKQQSMFLAKTNSINFINKTMSKAENFERFAITLQNLILYFPANTIFDDIDEELIVTIPLVSLRSFLKYEFDSLASEQDHLSEVNRIIDPSLPMIAITYDDGPNKEVTPRILNTMREYDGVATFFVLGARVRSHKDIIERIVKEGSELGNHTFGHKDLTKLKSEEMHDQYKATQEAVKSVVTDYTVNLIRPTYGTYNDFVKKNAPYPLILWSIDTKDWSHRNVERTVNEILDKVEDGDIILMHDMYPETAEATELVVPKLKEMGFQLVTVSELFEAKGIILEPGKIYYSAKK